MSQGTMMKKLEVMHDHKAVSKGLSHFRVNKFFLHTFTLKFTPTKKAPIVPPITPIRIAPIMSWYVFTELTIVGFPNLMVEPEKPSLTFFPSASV